MFNKYAQGNKLLYYHVFYLPNTFNFIIVQIQDSVIEVFWNLQGSSALILDRSVNQNFTHHVSEDKFRQNILYVFENDTIVPLVFGKEFVVF